MEREVKHITAPFELKGVDDEGVFSGYASVFGNIDSDGDIIAKGAFKKTLREWKKRKALPPVVWQHRFDKPIGPHTEMLEDDKGLFTEGQLLVNDIVLAREARALMKSNTIRGLSIGFVTMDARAPKKKDESETGASRVITEIDLFEVSIVTAAANREAFASSIKGVTLYELDEITKLESIRDMENFLREVGFSNNAAKVFVAKCKKQREAASGKSLGDLLKVLQDSTSEIRRK